MIYMGGEIAVRKVLRYDFSDVCEKIKPFHGVNSGPVTGNFACNHIKEFRDAGIPYARLHDVEGKYGGTYFVDIPNVFPDFYADPENPDSYDFEMNTNLLLTSFHGIYIQIK